LRLTLWWLAVAVWTAGLLMPNPGELTQDVLSPDATFTLAKTLHVSAYAFLAATVPWVGLPAASWWLVAFLSLHGAGTEFLQQWVPGRTASLKDVGLDNIGIALGLLATLRYWLGPRTPDD
jgi:VanZ family protein